jgi:hypothetical protein
LNELVIIIFYFLTGLTGFFYFGRSPDESDQTPIASGEGEQTHKLD